MIKPIALNLVLISVLALQIAAQSLLPNDKIPADLLITLKSQQGWGGAYSEMTISANGQWSYKTSGGLPVISMPEVLATDGAKPAKPKPVKSPFISNPVISEKKLRRLIAEFEKIRFFKFGEDFPPEDPDDDSGYTTDQGTETIVIRINGRTKEVSNDSGANKNRNRLLRDLAEKIRGAAIWNLPGGEIPDNFQVWYRTTDGDKVRQDFKIESNGEVTESFYASKPWQRDLTISTFISSKTVGKLSKDQLVYLIDEFEKIGFSAFKYSPLTKYAGCLKEPLSTTDTRFHINVQINHKSQMYASLYENCEPKPGTDAARFQYMNRVITKLLEDFNVIK